MTVSTTLEDILKNRLNKNVSTNPSHPSYDTYKHENGLTNMSGYTNAVNKLYASTRRDKSSFGVNERKINNKGLQNSGYSELIDDIAENKFQSGLASIKKNYEDKEMKNLLGYASYLEKYRDKQSSLKKSVMSHLIKNDVVDLGTAIAYGMSAGLSRADAEQIGKSAYDVTKRKIFNTLLEQTVSLGLDRDGAKLLALKMGISDSDAEIFAGEIDELLKYYGNISDEYLKYLEQRAN